MRRETKKGIMSTENDWDAEAALAARTNTHTNLTLILLHVAAVIAVIVAVFLMVSAGNGDYAGFDNAKFFTGCGVLGLAIIAEFVVLGVHAVLHGVKALLRH